MYLKDLDVNYLDMVASHTGAALQNGKNYGNTKEMIRAVSVLGLVHGHIAELAIGRWYMARSKGANRVYASVWFNVYGEKHADGTAGASHTIGGTGYAGGYGCELKSGAMNAALLSAGFKLTKTGSDNKDYTFYGAGANEADDALMACCVCLGYTDNLYVVTHG